MKISAAVARDAGDAVMIGSLTLEEPRPDEVRVRIVATGLCHTDLVVRDFLGLKPNQRVEAERLS